MKLVDDVELDRLLTAVCDRYEKTAPVVWAWADDLYRRLREQPTTVALVEITFLEGLRSADGTWAHPNAAANQVYKLLHRLGRDTTGMLGF